MEPNTNVNIIMGTKKKKIPVFYFISQLLLGLIGVNNNRGEGKIFFSLNPIKGLSGDLVILYF